MSEAIRDEVDWQRDLKWLQGLARRLAGGTDEANDLVQETWLHASAEPHARSRAWLGAVLRNRWRMRARGEIRRRAREAKVELETGALDPELALERTRVIELLCEALSTLSAVDRRIVILRHCEGFDASEIGSRLSLPPATVRTRLRRARARLKERLDQRWGDERPTWHLAMGIGPALVSKPVLLLGGSMTTAKIAASTAAAFTLIAATWWWTAQPSQSQQQPEAPEATEPAAALAIPAPAPAATEPVVPEPADDHAAKIARIREARRARLVETPESPPMVDARDVEAARESVRAFFRNEMMGEAMRATFAQLGEQIAESFLECLETFPAQRGRIRMRARLIGEPDVGTVVESVDVDEDTTGHTQLRECVEQSVYTFDFKPPDEALYDVYDLTLDLDEREISAGGSLPVEELPRMLAAYPELLAEVPAMLRDSPEIATQLRELFATDPDLAAQHPDLAQMLREHPT